MNFSLFRARQKLILASVLCLVFMIGEVVGGIFSNSLAIATDAAHLLTGKSFFIIKVAKNWHKSAKDCMKWYLNATPLQKFILAKLNFDQCYWGSLIEVALENYQHQHQHITDLQHFAPRDTTLCPRCCQSYIDIL